MSADSLYDDIRGFLRLTARVVSQVGSNINVGETFTLRFTGSNSAYAANLVGEPRIVFRNPRIFVQGTAFAAPVNGSAWHNLPDTELFPGESSSVDIVFRANSDLGFWDDIFSAEHVAEAWILGDLDQDRFFQIWNKIDVRQEIDET
ncbi:MAG: hypothetical protein HW403_285 [Dehalococcoidia bacterium]|nr:hypothetical protein [Dehalococcoidia bacterium]